MFVNSGDYDLLKVCFQNSFNVLANPLQLFFTELSAKAAEEGLRSGGIRGLTG